MGARLRVNPYFVLLTSRIEKMGATRSSLKTKRRRLVQLPFVTIRVYNGFNAAGYLCCAFTSTPLADAAAVVVTVPLAGAATCSRSLIRPPLVMYLTSKPA